jgi:3-isopropylmalate/(R)-2-methylmalate dehydratase large subunit
MPTPKTILDKIWDAHLVQSADGAIPLVYIDYQLLTETAGPQAFERLRSDGRDIWRPDRTIATIDRNVSAKAAKTPEVEKQIQSLVDNCREKCIGCFGIGNVNQGTVYVVAPEQGIVQPGMTIVGGVRGASTCGALGALALEVNSKESECVLAAQSLPMVKPKLMEIRIDGALPPGVFAKDLAMAVISKAFDLSQKDEFLDEYVIEYTGEAIRSLNMTGRLTLCNMTSYTGALGALVAPDELTFKYLKGRPHCPLLGREFDAAVTKWKSFRSDDGCAYDKTIQIDASEIKPTVSWEIVPGCSAAIDGAVPDPNSISDEYERRIAQESLEFMGFKPGQAITDIAVDCAFIGSSAGGRLGDLRAAAKVVKGYKCSPDVTAVVSPGSGIVKMKAEAAGLDKIFLDAGFRWGEPGSANIEPEDAPANGVCASTASEFQFQTGSGIRACLVSPAMAAAAAITGKITDIRNWEYR